MMTNRNILTLLATAVFALYGCGDEQGTENADTIQEARTTAPSASERTKDTGTKTILFFGNSLTAGYGLEPDQAFPALIQDRIDSLNLPYKVVNAGVSGETSAGGRSRIDWLLKNPVDVFVLELGANDGLRGIDPDETYKNLQAIIEKVREKNPDAKIILAGMQIPPNMGQKYSQRFREVFIKLAEEENVALIPFLLDGVAGNRDLNLEDGIHPTAEGQKILANNVWDVLEDVLEPAEAEA